MQAISSQNVNTKKKGARDRHHLLLVSCMVQQKEAWKLNLWLMKILFSMYGPEN
jgi:hypothetical protein